MAIWVYHKRNSCCCWEIVKVEFQSCYLKENKMWCFHQENKRHWEELLLKSYIKCLGGECCWVTVAQTNSQKGMKPVGSVCVCGGGVRVCEEWRNNPFINKNQHDSSACQTEKSHKVEKVDSWRYHTHTQTTHTCTHTLTHTLVHTRTHTHTHTTEKWCDFRQCAQEFLISLIRVRRSCIYYHTQMLARTLSHTHAHYLHLFILLIYLFFPILLRIFKVTLYLIKQQKLRWTLGFDPKSWVVILR